MMAMHADYDDDDVADDIKTMMIIMRLLLLITCGDDEWRTFRMSTLLQVQHRMH